jgi:hypothetical protein
MERLHPVCTKTFIDRRDAFSSGSIAINKEISSGTRNSDERLSLPSALLILMGNNSMLYQQVVHDVVLYDNYPFDFYLFFSELTAKLKKS